MFDLNALFSHCDARIFAAWAMLMDHLLEVPDNAMLRIQVAAEHLRRGHAILEATLEEHGEHLCPGIGEGLRRVVSDLDDLVPLASREEVDRFSRDN
jgi:hypothetical protein